MAVKEWFRKLQPVQLYLVLFFTTAFFAVEIVESYVSHSLTLLMNAYHMVCNIVALVGCIASIKYENESDKSHKNSLNSLKASTNTLNGKASHHVSTNSVHEKVSQHPSANSIKEKVSHHPSTNRLNEKTTDRPPIISLSKKIPIQPSTHSLIEKTWNQQSTNSFNEKTWNRRSTNSLNENISSQSSIHSLNEKTWKESSTNSLNVKTLVQSVQNKKSKQSHSEKRMKNTFGWARIDIVTMLVCCVLLASFCFSLMVEALQTLIHISHIDAMHHPLPVMSIGASGILLNAFCYLLIGGYTFNQGAFLHFTKNGDVVLKRTIAGSQPKVEGEVEQIQRSPIVPPRSQGLHEMCRDVLGCVLVIVDSCVVYFTDIEIAKYVDPILAIVSAISLFVLSYPYMKESGLILLQTIPNHINIQSLQMDLLAAFPDIINVHDLHVWQLNGEKVVSTVHIIYADPTVCARITDQITGFFIEMGITHVTIQPEFCKMKPHTGPHIDCLIRCQSKHCSASTCCSRYELDEVEQHRRHIINRRFGSKEMILPISSTTVDLKRFSINISELTVTSVTSVHSETVVNEPETSVIPTQSSGYHQCTVNVDVVKSATAPSANEEELTTITECGDGDSCETTRSIECS